jgi:methyl-accepting chemotaxis protein
VVLLVVLTGFYFFNQRSIVRPLTVAINHIDRPRAPKPEAAGEISSTQPIAGGRGGRTGRRPGRNQLVAGGTMSSMTKRNAENAQKANELARQARTAADKGVKTCRP